MTRKAGSHQLARRHAVLAHPLVSLVGRDDAKLGVGVGPGGVQADQIGHDCDEAKGEAILAAGVADQTVGERMHRDDQVRARLLQHPHDVPMGLQVDDLGEHIHAAATVGQFVEEIEDRQPACRDLVVEFGCIADERETGAGEQIDDMAIDVRTS